MACTAPETYYKRNPELFAGKGGLTKDPRKALVNGRTITLACGKCIDCRLRYSREWALRCMHEQQMSGASSFVTLTYDDEHIPDDWDLNYYHFQLFMHKLRKTISGAGRFFMSGEYGDTTFRPHYHAILFNCDFADKVFHSCKDGINYYTSAMLARLWGHGFCLIGDVTLASAGYVARYNLKKITGPSAGSAYQFITPDGVLVDRRPPFCKSSLQPGIGATWFDKFHADVFPCDFMVYQGKRFPVPRYYTKLLERKDEAYAERIKLKRRLAAIDNKDNPELTPRRLAVKNELAILVSQQKRDLS